KSFFVCPERSWAWWCGGIFFDILACAHVFRLSNQRSVRGGKSCAQMGENFEQFFGLESFGHVLRGRLVRLRKISKEHAFATRKPILSNILVEAHVTLDEITGDGLRAYIFAVQPGVGFRKAVVGF